jgi:hypothetical protein
MSRSLEFSLQAGGGRLKPVFDLEAQTRRGFPTIGQMDNDRERGAWPLRRMSSLPEMIERAAHCVL